METVNGGPVATRPGPWAWVWADAAVELPAGTWRDLLAADRRGADHEGTLPLGRFDLPLALLEVVR